VDDNLLAAAQYFDFVRATVGRHEDRRADLVERFIHPKQHGAFGCLSGTDGTCSHHPLGNFLYFIGDGSIKNVDIDGWNSAGQNSGICRVGIFVCPTVDLHLRRLDVLPSGDGWSFAVDWNGQISGSKKTLTICCGAIQQRLEISVGDGSRRPED
jgi:hypothetical protein